ncbi:V-type ATP synthase subunit B [Candidatus Bathyarchaeota archaeon]|nr:V-type ATP synthase subunit B [Candidatus Bathyarchaeota archaeon]RJS75110.1 MAG: V-type ATP synthase subunit B [Candidatus Bathyarchaeota archaeon]
MDLQGKIYKGVREIRGSLLFVEGVSNVGYDEVVKIRGLDGVDRMGRVLDVSRDTVVVQILGNVEGLQSGSYVTFTGSSFEIPVSDEVLGRMFNGRYEPIDGLPPVYSKEKRDINGAPINPKARVHPHDFIQTGISAIDGMLSLVRGQKLPFFSESGLPHDRLIAQVIRQATVRGEEERFAVVFAAMGLKNDEARFFIEQLRESGALERSVLVLNLASDPAIERLLTPRIALTIAEFLAFDLEIHVLTILSDMTNYCESLRELSTARDEVPGRGGYPGYMYSDLATIYERAGIISGKKGSLTQMPCLTMPGGDINHPIPDLTGYITEGQIFLDKDLHSRGIYPPINVLPSLSRLMRRGIGPGKTREDHKDVSDQLYDAYSRGMEARGLARIVGEVGLSERERRYLKFADEFERRFVNQGEFENRSIERTLDIAWEILSILPEDELVRIHEEYIKKYHPKYRRSMA